MHFRLTASSPNVSQEWTLLEEPEREQLLTAFGLRMAKHIIALQASGGHVELELRQLGA